MNDASFWERLFKIEKVVVDIFTSVGYSVTPPSNHKGHGYDIGAERKGIKYAIEIKSLNTLEYRGRVLLRSADRVLEVARKEKRIPVLAITNLLSKQLENELSQYEELIVIDLHNMLYMVKDNNRLRNELVSALDFSVDEIKPIMPNLEVDQIEKNEAETAIDNYIGLLEAWEPKENTSFKYEELCYQSLKEIFADDLSLWNTQQKSNDGLFRFDLICKIKEGNGKEFWRMAERYFKSKYIVFEFKNYSGKVTQKEVFTTEKYLYLKALRGIAILISANGTDEHADKAIRGVLREEGKLIISISNEDLIYMLKQKKSNEEPADYLSDKLDGLLIDLEK